ncbi:hypothetical protein BS47DRAFT_1337201 [Hydnum rufescens UP504]|uniref:Fatty acid hydroxylase domain-containing protein n=1 Tax=Hydnum rufescens UP504 TaxID=1448309 RepID=A0A9P6B7Y0_9AGAM|nr:hypothetical protein BS47DRAFT_1337201 [Hydnum rufescens UP504]
MDTKSMSAVLPLDPLEIGSESSKDPPAVKLSPVASERSEPFSVNHTAPFMRSTWHKDPTKTSISNPLGWVAYRTMLKGEARPREGKVAVHPLWTQHVFILSRAIAPIAIQYISMKYFHLSWPIWMAVIVYSIAYIAILAMTVVRLNALTLKHGFLDGHVPRDGIPDVRLKSTVIGLLFFVTVRPLMYCLVAYDRFEMPYITPWLPVHVFLFTTILDFWFYIYHRAMHEVDFLWRFHKTHHMAKHPIPLLAAFSDHVQELMDSFVIHMFAYFVYPLDFFTLWICAIYIEYVELCGHSGVRLFCNHPVSGPILRPFDMDLSVEDHDLHHRHGWRKSFNYGKQTRVWDKLFGTTRARVEMAEENLDR